MLSRLASPDVTVASAVLATVAMPFLIPAQRLLCKTASGEVRPWAVGAAGAVGASPTSGGTPATFAEGGADAAHAPEFRDGSIVHDTPRELLAQHFGVSYTIVSQCNPHVVPLHAALRPSAGMPAVSRLQRGRADWLGGFASSALLSLLWGDAMKWLRMMRELEIAPLVLNTDWSGLFLQDFSGDVTIMPPLGVRDYLRMRPSRPGLERAHRDPCVDGAAGCLAPCALPRVATAHSPPIPSPTDRIVSHDPRAALAVSDPTRAVMDRFLSVGQRECWRKIPMLATRLRIAHALQELQAALSLTNTAAAPADAPVDGLAPPGPMLTAGAASPSSRATIRRVDSTLCF